MALYDICVASCGLTEWKALGDCLHSCHEEPEAQRATDPTTATTQLEGGQAQSHTSLGPVPVASSSSPFPLPSNKVQIGMGMILQVPCGPSWAPALACPRLDLGTLQDFPDAALTEGPRALALLD